MALDDSYTAGEDAAPTVVGNAVTDNDTDVDGDLLTAVPQTAVAGSNGGRFTLATDGTVTFDPHGDFEDLAVGEVHDDAGLRGTDADGATDTATISVTARTMRRSRSAASATSRTTTARRRCWT
ncbi:MAG: Ig-like domain-containing protein [Pirellulales bacterium]